MVYSVILNLWCSSDLSEMLLSNASAGSPLRPLKSESQGQWEERHLLFNSFSLILKVTNV